MENKAGEIKQEEKITNGADTSHTAGAEGGFGDKDSLALGKFSSVQDLLNAYNSLESEFTRRSQKLKELVRENESLKKTEQPKKDSDSLSQSKGKIAFVEKYPEAKEILPSLYDTAVSSGDEAEGFLERAYVKYLKDKLNSQKEYYLSNEYILETAKNSKALKDGIIREYLGDVSVSKPKVGQYLGNGDGIYAPPSKPKTMQEANNLALKIFENSKEIH